MVSKIDIVLGDESMALYKDGDLVVAATRLTFIDILEGAGIPADIWEGDTEKYDSPEKFPKSFKEVVMDHVEAST